MFMGQDGFIWWIGVVEDIDDPMLLGRMRVRIFGYHPQYKVDENINIETSINKVPISELPWAIQIMPTNMTNAYGTGNLGDWVIGFFLDGKDAQEPAILGYIPALPPAETPTPDVLFGKYGNNVRTFSHVYNNATNEPFRAQDYAEPGKEYSRRRDRFSYKTKSGHLLEFIDDVSSIQDSTVDIRHAGGARLLFAKNLAGTSSVYLIHPSGTHYKINTDGAVQILHTSGSNIQLTADGNAHITAASGKDIYINGVGGSYALTQKITSMDSEIALAKTLPAASGGDGGGGSTPSGPEGGGNDGGGPGGGKIICTKLYELGILPHAIYEADQQFGAELNEKHPDIYDGYYAWAIIVVQWMEGNGPDCMLWIRDEEKRKSSQMYLSRKWAEEIATPWAKHMAHLMGVEKETSLTGKVLMAVGLPICKAIGVWRRFFGKSTKPAGLVKGYALWAVFSVLRATVSIMSLFERGEKQ